MPYLTAAVILVAAASATNLVLTFGIIRRMRSTTASAAAVTGRSVSPPPTLPVGTELAPFTAHTVDGREVGRESLLGERGLIGFFSTSCGACKEQVPDFAAYAAGEGFGADRALAVVQGPAAEATEFVAAHFGSAGTTVIVEPEGGPVSQALGVVAFPLFYLVNAEGRLEQVEFTVKRLHTTVGA
jgi:hypothetical protein